MWWRRRSVLILALMAVLADPLFGRLFLFAQESAPVASPAAIDTTTPKPQFFAGVVSHIDAKRVNVSRTLVGRNPESHAFLIDSKTKMPKGGIRSRTRVTVRYQHRPEGDLALEIQIRPVTRVTKAP